MWDKASTPALPAVSHREHVAGDARPVLLVPLLAPPRFEPLDYGRSGHAERAGYLAVGRLRVLDGVGAHPLALRRRAALVAP